MPSSKIIVNTDMGGRRANPAERGGGDRSQKNKRAGENSGQALSQLPRLPGEWDTPRASSCPRSGCPGGGDASPAWVEGLAQEQPQLQAQARSPRFGAASGLQAGRAPAHGRPGRAEFN